MSELAERTDILYIAYYFPPVGGAGVASEFCARSGVHPLASTRQVIRMLRSMVRA